jgi:hypothetical protein
LAATARLFTASRASIYDHQTTNTQMVILNASLAPGNVNDTGVLNRDRAGSGMSADRAR